MVLVTAAIALAAAALPALAIEVVPPGPSSYTYIFGGCAPANTVHVYNSWAKTYGLQNQAQCDAYLASQPDSNQNQYSFFINGPTVGENECFGGNDPPWDNLLVEAVPWDSDGACYGGYARIGVRKYIAGVYEATWAGCYHSQTQIDPPAYAGNFFNGGTQYGERVPWQVNRAGCLAVCGGNLATLKVDNPAMYASSKYAYALYYAAGVPEVAANNDQNCICSLGPVQAGGTAQCENYFGGDKFTMDYLYAIDISEQPSAGAVRRRADRLRQKALLDETLNQYCPAGLTPCHVAPNSEGYECIDTSSELESCGGCLFGEYARRAGRKREVLGKDCTSLLGVEPAAASCRNHACGTTACRPGYRLVFDHCVQGVQR